MQISYLLFAKWLCAHTHAHMHTYTVVLQRVTHTHAHKRMWWCESIILCCHRVTCEPWQGADGPGVPSFLFAVPFSHQTLTLTPAQKHTPSLLGFPRATYPQWWPLTNSRPLLAVLLKCWVHLPSEEHECCEIIVNRFLPLLL